jgi:hypothetical protein
MTEDDSGFQIPSYGLTSRPVLWPKGCHVDSLAASWIEISVREEYAEKS